LILKRNKALVNLKVIWILFSFMLLLVLVSLISPFQDILNPVIGVSGLNCEVPQDGYRGTCIVLRGAMLWFIFGVGYAIIKGLLNKLAK